MTEAPSTESPDDPVAALRKRSRILARLLDDDGRVRRWPKRRTQKLLILEHLAQHFEPGERLPEAQVNDLLNSLHAFDDAALLRRWLVEEGLLARTASGSAYWLESTEATGSGAWLGPER
jgi:hypothetical protein